MKAHDEGVVEDKHECCEPPGGFGIPEEHLTDVTDVLNLRVTQAKLPVADVSQCEMKRRTS